MSFLQPFNLRSKRIVTAVVKMAKVIDIHTLAEGVETGEQFVYLRDIGCEKVQGFYFDKPMPFEEAVANLQEKGIQTELPPDRKFYIAKDFMENYAAKIREGGPYAPAQLWNNLIRSDLFRIFWKDRDRRFLGASKGFLDFYGFSSADEIIGKNDEEMGWHVHPDLFMNDEYRVIHEGITFRNMPGNCISNGENREILASKTPLYDGNGEITGLLGYFVDRASLDMNDKRGEESSRRELLTGLLNSRGISEEAEAFQDEYYLRGTDFVRIHIGINDFTSINEQYGFDFGDIELSGNRDLPR